MDVLLWSGLKYWKSNSIANSVQLLCKCTVPLVTWLWGWKSKGFQKSRIPKFRCGNWYTTNIFCHVAHVSGAIWDSSVHHTKSSSVYLLWILKKIKYKKNLSIPCQKISHFYQSFREREEEFIKCIFKGSYRNVSNFTTCFYRKKKNHVSASSTYYTVTRYAGVHHYNQWSF